MLNPTSRYRCTTPSVLCFCCALFLVFYGVGLLAVNLWPALQIYDTAFFLAAIGLTCTLNFVLKRTLHCGITGPLFLLGAGVMALDAAGVWSVREDFIWSLALIGVGVAFLLEQLYAQRVVES